MPPKLLACNGSLYKVIHKIGCIRSSISRSPTEIYLSLEVVGISAWSMAHLIIQTFMAAKCSQLGESANNTFGDCHREKYVYNGPDLLISNIKRSNKILLPDCDRCLLRAPARSKCTKLTISWRLLSLPPENQAHFLFSKRSEKLILLKKWKLCTKIQLGCFRMSHILQLLVPEPHIAISQYGVHHASWWKVRKAVPEKSVLFDEIIVGGL